MTERPILFSAPMVKAILAGTKTMTRRVIKPQPPAEAGDVDAHPDYPGEWFYWLNGCERSATFHCPYGEAGADRLWVRETWSKSALGVYPCPSHWFRADFTEHEDPSRADLPHDRGCTGNRADCFACVAEREGKFRWRPAIHMPRRASRILLDVTAVRVERLQDISEADAKAEGVEQYESDGPIVQGPNWNRMRFEDLWQSINGRRPGCDWASNPWIWVVSFRRVESTEARATT